jgi:hypothetical protein
MNQQVHHDDNDEMRPEYDFSHGVRGKHYQAYRAGTNVVFLEPDVAKAFADSASVNQVLRLLLQLAKTNVPVETRLTMCCSRPTAVAERAGNPRQRRRLAARCKLSVGRGQSDAPCAVFTDD